MATATSTQQNTGTNQIVRAAIYPSIGIARVGNSQNEYFIGPEVPDPLPAAPGFYRDPTGALKRQAARFRVYGLDAQGDVVAELTAADAAIEWTVHLANKKSAWYQFQLAQDIPEAAEAPPQLLRNSTVTDRASLAIDPGARTIAAGQAPRLFDTGSFLGTTVYLGEIRTDTAGRLIVLGGHGKSASHGGQPAITFANNEGWYDDTSDGPVTATVTYQGKALSVDPAWVVVAPPDYGPAQKSVRTMWDLMRDVAIKAGMLTAPVQPSFNNDIRPILEHMSHLQWVNAGIFGAFGWGSGNDFTDPARLARLNDNTAASTEYRQGVALCFRRFDRDAWSPVPWPWMYGDAMSVPTPHTPLAFTALTDTQLSMLDQWAAGDFIADYVPGQEPPRRIEDVPVAEQPATLDRAALEFCLADAFHPGCEMTWPMRLASMYMAPFRLKHAPPGWVEPFYGPQMNADLLSSPVFTGQVPGGITRWMAIPWQTDTASCLSGYGKTFGPYLPTFWPARVPNQVMTPQAYEVVMNTAAPIEDRLNAFAQRAAWNAQLTAKGGYLAQINGLVADISQMGVVEVREGPAGDPRFPPTIQVEDRSLVTSTLATAAHAVTGQDADLDSIAKVHRFASSRARL